MSLPVGHAMNASFSPNAKFNALSPFGSKYCIKKHNINSVCKDLLVALFIRFELLWANAVGTVTPNFDANIRGRYLGGLPRKYWSIYGESMKNIHVKHLELFYNKVAWYEPQGALNYR